ncbi:MAG: hypothetical protein HY226_00860 [Candidatus Vogelbacteria bacterium]|nr:hypothetical protein [Candidatus Vogelbacteria bacterium]
MNKRFDRAELHGVVLDKQKERKSRSLEELYEKVLKIKWQVLTEENTREVLLHWARQVVDFARNTNITKAIFMDRGARPLVYLFKTYWDVKNLDGGYMSQPEILFLAPRSFTEPSDTNTKKIKKHFAESGNWGGHEKVLVVDDFVQGGSTVDSATKLIEQAFPGTIVAVTAPFNGDDTKAMFSTQGGRRAPWDRPNGAGGDEEGTESLTLVEREGLFVKRQKPLDIDRDKIANFDKNKEAYEKWADLAKNLRLEMQKIALMDFKYVEY